MANVDYRALLVGRAEVHSASYEYGDAVRLGPLWTSFVRGYRSAYTVLLRTDWEGEAVLFEDVFEISAYSTLDFELARVEDEFFYTSRALTREGWEWVDAMLHRSDSKPLVREGKLSILRGRVSDAWAGRLSQSEVFTDFGLLMRGVEEEKAARLLRYLPDAVRTRNVGLTEQLIRYVEDSMK